MDKKNDEKMMLANRSKDGLQISMKDGLCVHVLLKRITVIPGREQFPITTEVVRCYQKEVFDKMEALRNDRNPIIWYRAGGFTEAVVVHDPSLLTVEQKSEIEKYRAEVLKPKPLVPRSVESMAQEIKKLKRQMKKVQ